MVSRYHQQQQQQQQQCRKDGSVAAAAAAMQCYMASHCGVPPAAHAAAAAAAAVGAGGPPGTGPPPPTHPQALSIAAQFRLISNHMNFSYSPHQQSQQRELNNYSHQLNAPTFATPGQTGVQQTAPAGPGTQNNQQVSIGATQSDGPRTPWRPSHPANQQSAPQSASIGPPSQAVASNPAGPVPNTPGGPPPNSQPPQQPTGIPGGTGGRHHHPLTVPPPPQGPPQTGGSQAQPSPAPPTSTPPADHLASKLPQCGPLHTAHMSSSHGLPMSFINQQPQPPRPSYPTQYRQTTPRMPNHNRNGIQVQGNNVGQNYVQPHMNFSGFIQPHGPIVMQQQHYLPGYQYTNQHQQRQQNHAPPYYSAAAAAAPANMILNSPYGHGHYPNPVQMYYSMPRAPTPTGPGQQLQQGAQAQPLLAPPAQMHQGPLSLVPMPIQTVTPNQQPQAQPQQGKRRRTHALKIIDPKTFEEVTVEVDNTPSHSGESSARQTPQPNNTDVAAEFAAQVYKLAAEAKRVTTQTLTATVDSTTTTVAQTITTPICSSSLKLSSLTTTANTISSVESSSTLVENIESVSNELEVFPNATKIISNEPSNTGSSSIWKKTEKPVDPTPVVSANTNAPAVHVKKMNTSDSSQIKSSSIKNINKSSSNQILTSLSQEKGKSKEEKEKTLPLEVSKSSLPSTQIKQTTKGRRNEREKSNSKSRDREPTTSTSPVPLSSTTNETLLSSSTPSSTGAIPRETKAGLLSEEGYCFYPAGKSVDGLSKPLSTKDSTPAPVALSTVDSKTETSASQVSNSNSIKVPSKVRINTPSSSPPDLSNIQPAETTVNQADLKTKDVKDSKIDVLVSSSSANSSDEEGSNKKKAKRSQTGSTHSSVSTNSSSTTPIPVLSNSTTTETTPTGLTSGELHISPEVSTNQTAASNQVPTIMKELLSSSGDEKSLEISIANNPPSNITQDINSNIQNNVLNSSSRPESPIQNTNTENKETSELNMIVKSNEPSKIDEKEKIDQNKNDIDSTSEISNHVDDSNSETSALPANKPEVPTRTNLKYDEEQWSPMNPDGKKKYGREFLLELKNDPESKKLPENLPDLDIVIKDSNNRDWNTQPRAFDRMSNMRNQHDILTPNFMRTGNNPRPQLGKRNSQQGKPNKGNKGMIQFSISLKDEVKLHESANAWKPDRLKQSQSQEDIEKQKTDELYKKVRGVLNKLTPQKFETLVCQVKALPIDNAERLTGVIKLVFEKAVDEPSFSVAYAGMCQVLQNMQVPVTNSGQKSEMANFRKILINRCQEEFEKNKEAEINKDKKIEEINNCSDPEKKKELQTTLEEEWRRIRMKSLGNMRFIGELYKLSMLTVNIMHRCIKQLLNGTDEESLECLCKLLTTIGKDLESKKQDMGSYIEQMKQLANRRKEISSRVRFMVQDVEELRHNNWVPRRDDSNPKTIDQIQKEAERERDAIETMNLTLSNTPRKDDRLQDRRKTKNETDWQHVSSSSRRIIEMNKIKQMKGTIDGQLELGHKGKFSQWGSGAATKKEEKKTPAFNNNKFAALDTSDLDKRPTDLIRSSNTLGLDMESDRKRMLNTHRNEGRSTPPVSRSHSRDNSSAHRDAHNTMPFANVVSITSSMGSGIQGPSVGSSNSGPVSREILSTRGIITPSSTPATTTTTTTTTTPPESMKTAVLLDDYKIKRHTLIILDEYLSNVNLEEVSLGVLDHFIVEQRIDFVNEILNQGMERSVSVREHIGTMLASLVTKDTLKANDVLDGFMNLFEVAEDIIIDVPKFWNFSADILAPIINSKSVSWTQFRDAIKAKNIDCSQLLPHLFQIIVKVQTPSTIRQAFEEQKVEFRDFLPPHSDLDKYIKDNKLEYLVSSSPVNISSLTRQITEQEIKEKITQLLKAENMRTLTDSFSDWTNINVGDAVKKPAFIRALTTAICEVSLREIPNTFKLHEETFNSLNILLTKYIDNNPELELQCIYAIQAFVHKLEHPSSLLYDIFNHLWESSIISSEAFFQWENSKDPAEAQGKAVAVKSVVALFSLMKETEDSDED